MLRIAACLSVIVAATAIPAPRHKDPEKLPPITEEMLRQASDKMDRLGGGLHGYYETVGCLPVDLKRKDGTPALSWRVLIHPYIGEEDLYRKFKIEESLDSPHNLKLAENIPALYAPIQGAREAGGDVHPDGGR